MAANRAQQLQAARRPSVHCRYRREGPRKGRHLATKEGIHEAEKALPTRPRCGTARPNGLQNDIYSMPLWAHHHPTSWAIWVMRSGHLLTKHARHLAKQKLQEKPEVRSLWSSPQLPVVTDESVSRSIMLEFNV